MITMIINKITEILQYVNYHCNQYFIAVIKNVVFRPHFYNDINPIVEYAPNGSVLARYIYAGGLHIAKVAGADTHWYHCDALGSPRKMTDERGSTVWSAIYYPFGEMTAGSNNTHGFTGKEFDSEMGLNYFCQRYYDPEIGRFTTLDPFAGYIELPQTQNRYAYCIGNPLKYIDPLGLVMQGEESSYPDCGFVPGVTVYAPRYIQDEPYDWGYMEGFGNTGILNQGFGDYYDGCGGNHGGKGGGRRRYGSRKSGGENYSSLSERLQAHLDALMAMGIGALFYILPPEVNIAMAFSTNMEGQTAILLGQTTDGMAAFTGVLAVGGFLAGGPLGTLVAIPVAGCTGFMYYQTYDYCLKHPDWKKHPDEREE